MVQPHHMPCETKAQQAFRFTPAAQQTRTAPACAQFHSLSDSMLHTQKAPHMQLCMQAPAQLTTCFTPQANWSSHTHIYTTALCTQSRHTGGMHFVCNKVGCMQRLLTSPNTGVQLESAEGGCNAAVSCTVRLPTTRKNKKVTA